MVAIHTIRPAGATDSPIRICSMGEGANPAAKTAELVQAIRAGDSSAADALMPLVYDELRGIAAALMRQCPPDYTLQPTAVVHEVYIRLMGADLDWRDRAHFLAIAASALRHVLVDYARHRNAQKRGGDGQRLTLDAAADRLARSGVDVLALHDALARLGELHERQARVVELRFFGGLGNEDVAHVLGIARSTVADDWRVARLWLLRELGESAP